MTIPKLSFSTKVTAFTKGSAYVIGVELKSGKPTIIESAIATDELKKLDLDGFGVKGTFEAVTRLPAPNGAVFLLIGIGKKQLTADVLRELGGAAARNLIDQKELVFGLPTASKTEAIALLEGASLGQYQFGAYKGLNKLTGAKTAKITVVTTHKPATESLRRLEILCETVSSVKNLVNSPANDIYPQTLAGALQKAARGTGVTVEIWDEKRLAAEGFGGILAVGKGSSRPPRLVKIDYKPKGAKAHLAFVGKGITFDSGGLSIKPAASMVGMKYDMTGSATVGHAALAIAKLGLPVRVTAWLCLAENLVSGTSTRPSDVIKIRNGKTVEVINTDAEGRLVLADGLSVASEAKPDLIVDVATLTGAASVALGNRITGLMGHGDAVERLSKAAQDAGESVWHMPLPEDLRMQLNSEIADIANAKFGANGGMLLGGLFLQEFIGSKTKDGEQISWAHLDIAPTANNDLAPYGYTGKGATGVMVRTLVSLAESYA